MRRDTQSAVQLAARHRRVTAGAAHPAQLRFERISRVLKKSPETPKRKKNWESRFTQGIEARGLIWYQLG